MEEAGDSSLTIIAAKTGFTDGKQYESFRPSYTDEAVAKVVEMLLSDSSKLPGCDYDVLELGAGTGKFTRLLLNNVPKDTKLCVTEPMEDFLRTLKKSCPDVKTIQCAASSIPLPDHSVKAIVAAQCIHWFANNDALSEIQRVLTPGGNFVIIYNARDPASDLNHQYYEMLAKNWQKGTPQYIDQQWKYCLNEFTGMSLQARIYTHGIHYEGDIDCLVRFASTISIISSLPDEEKKQALKQLRHLYSTHPHCVGKDIISLPMKTDILHYKSRTTKTHTYKSLI